MKDAAPFSHKTRIAAGDFCDCGSADVVILAAGVHQTPQRRSRLEDLEQSADIMRQVIAELMQHDPRGVILIASNPVDILTYASWKWSGLPANRVISSGTSLDTVRFRRRPGERYGVAAENVHAYIRGGTADTNAPPMFRLDLAAHGVSSVIWASGYTFDFSLVQLPIRDADGYPIQKRGITEYPGLYFLGMPWLHSRKSGFLCGVGNDAAHVVSHLLASRLGEAADLAS